MDEKALSALHNLSRDEDFMVFVKWLESQVHHLQNQMLSIKEEVPLRWAQGQCQAIKDVLTNIGNADALYEMAKNNRRTHNGSATGNTTAPRKDERWT